MKSLFLRLSSFLLPGTLFIFGLSLSLLLVFGQPQPIKSAVSGSGLYNVLLHDVLTGQGATTVGSVQIPLSDPKVEQAISSAFTPQVLQGVGDNLIDGFYGWIQGKTDKPTFNVNLLGARAQAAENVATYVAGRVASLPICTTAGLYEQYANGTLATGDYYKLSCRPASLSTQTVHDTVQRSILGSSDFANELTFDASTITDDSGQPLYKKLSFVPTAYKVTVWTTYATGVLAVLALVGVIFLRPNRRQGAKRGAIIVLVCGILSTLLALVTVYGMSYLENLIISAAGTDTGLQVKIADIARALLTDVRNWWLWISGIEIALGIGILLGLRLSRKPTVSAPTPKIDDVTPIKEVEKHPAPQDKIEL
ncbi:MAG TPA: hypothetical protein VJ843_05815 [Candidatus Saccharimonadales bacterium]|nr:hypothetical protein [Candidatus Saccharimonadales bacterium]